MAKIDMSKPCTLGEVQEFVRDAQFGYDVPDSRTYSRHVNYLLWELEKAQQAARVRVVSEPDQLPAVASEGDE